MPFLKFQGENGSSRGKLWWHRAGEDGAPFRGNAVPLLRDHEFEEKVERVWDCHYGTFDTSQPDQQHSGRTLSWIMDAAMSGWVRVIHRDWRWMEKDGVPVMYQYIEWAEPYQELSVNANQEGQ